jgi:protein-L-isoaspartate(D-aspartate) O-methyltransferase
LDSPELRRLRSDMVERYVLGRGIREPWILRVMQAVPRHRFVDEALWQRSYGDHALPIGERQTISQPYTIAQTLQALELRGGEKVLEIGTGSGYQTALLAEIAGQVFSMERKPALARRARKILDELGYLNIQLRAMDGSYGWNEEAPFDAVLISAVAESIPVLLAEQVREGGKLVMPLREKGQEQLIQIERSGKGWRKTVLGPCRFVPLLTPRPAGVVPG